MQQGLKGENYIITSPVLFLQNMVVSFHSFFPLSPSINKKRFQVIPKLQFWQSWITSDIPSLLVVQGKDFCWRLWLTSGLNEQLSFTGNPGPKEDALCHRPIQALISLLCAVLRNNLRVQRGVDRTAELQCFWSLRKGFLSPKLFSERKHLETYLERVWAHYLFCREPRKQIYRLYKNLHIICPTVKRWHKHTEVVILK